MKYLYNNIVLVLFVLSVVSCDITNNLDDFDPDFVLNAENAINDAKSAESALTGIYSALRTGTLTTDGPAARIEMGITATNNFVVNEFITNNPSIDNPVIEQFYTVAYDIINRANWVIERVSALDDSDGFEGNRRSEIIAEAKIFRAICHFDLLRNYGKFYDMSADNGIVVKDMVSRDLNPKPRSSVQQSYDFIIGDLNDAIANGPDSSSPFFLSTTFAKGLKAKVQLYMGDFSGAAVTAKEVIDDTSDIFELEASLQDIYVEQFDSPEALFAPFSRFPDQQNFSGFTFGFAFSSTPAFNAVGNGSTIIDGVPVAHDFVGFPFSRTGYMNFPLPGAIGKYFVPAAFNGEMNFTYFYLRMAEIYLIHAEAEARRSGGVIGDALASLNTIRLRGLSTPYPATINSEQLLEAIRIDKILELAAEGGEDFFDMIRYEALDGSGIFKVVDQKASASDPNKYIWPIPRISVEVSNNVVEQNPGY